MQMPKREPDFNNFDGDGNAFFPSDLLGVSWSVFLKGFYWVSPALRVIPQPRPFMFARREWFTSDRNVDVSKADAELCQARTRAVVSATCQPYALLHHLRCCQLSPCSWHDGNSNSLLAVIQWDSAFITSQAIGSEITLKIPCTVVSTLIHFSGATSQGIQIWWAHSILLLSWMQRSLLPC